MRTNAIIVLIYHLCRSAVADKLAWRQVEVSVRIIQLQALERSPVVDPSNDVAPPAAMQTLVPSIMAI